MHQKHFHIFTEYKRKKVDKTHPLYTLEEQQITYDTDKTEILTFPSFSQNDTMDNKGQSNMDQKKQRTS